MAQLKNIHFTGIFLIFCLVAGLFIYALIDWRVQPRNVIFMVSDGFGSASETFAREYAKFLKSMGKLDVDWEGFPDMLPLDTILVGQSRTRSSDSLVTDSAAGATAFSCLHKSYNGAVGVLPDETPCISVLEAAKLAGYKTGMVVTSRITHATPAAFSSHVTWRDYESEIAAHQVQGSAFGRVVDLMFGGGLCFFLPNTTSGSCRSDTLDLELESVENYGFSKFITEKVEFDSLSGAQDEFPLIALFSDDHLAYAIDQDPSAQPSLLDMTKKALHYLKQATFGSSKGFFLLIEGSRIDMAAHSNDAAAHAHEILAYQDVINFVKKFTEENPGTIMISTSDHETGGLTLGRQISSAYPPYVWYPEVITKVKNSTEAIVSLLLQTPASKRGNFSDIIIRDYLGISNYTEQDRVYISSEKRGKFELIDYLSHMVSRRALLGWTTHGHTGVDVNLYAYAGKKHEHLLDILRGSKENIDIGAIMQKLLGISNHDMQLFNKALVEAWKEGKFKTMPDGYPSRPHSHHEKPADGVKRFHGDDVILEDE